MKVLIINQHLHNYGDEAAGTAVVKNLLKRDSVDRIEILYMEPGQLSIEDDKVYHNRILYVRKLRKRQFVRYILTGKAEGQFLPGFLETLKAYDVILVSPCGANLGIYKDWHLLMQDIIVVRNKKKLIFHLNTIGRSGDRLFDYLVLWLCKRSKVYVREKASYEYLNNNGVSATLGTDSAFGLETSPLSYNGERVSESNILSFIPSDLWSWHPDFKNIDSKEFETKIVDAVTLFAKKNNLSIVIVPHLNSIDERNYNEYLMSAILKKEPGLKISIANATNFYEYERAIARSKIVIAMRYHAAVFSCKNCVPFVTLAYEQKMIEVAQYSHQEMSCVDLKTQFTRKQVQETLEYTINNRAQIRQDLKSIMPEISKKSLIVIEDNF